MPAATTALADGRRLDSSPAANPQAGFLSHCPPLATPAIAETARTEAIYKGEKFSGHAPITVEYQRAL
jgi:hypothetical protein